MTPPTIRQIHAILSGAFAAAVRWEWIDRNAASSAKLPKADPRSQTGTHTGDEFGDMPYGPLPTGTAKVMRFTGTTVLNVQNGLITEEIASTGCVIRAVEEYPVIFSAARI